MTLSLDDISQAAGDLLHKGDPASALPLYLEAIKIAKASGRAHDVSDLLGDLAVAYRRLGDVDAAIATNRRAIEAARACGSDLNIARWSGNLGGLLCMHDDVDGSEVCFREAMEAAARSGSPEQMSIAGGHFASIMGERGRFSEAVAIMEEARTHAAASPAMVPIIRNQEAQLYLKWVYSLRTGNRLREARDVIARAMTLLAEAPPSKETMLLLILLGDLEETDGNVVAASAAIERAAGVCEAMGDESEALKLRDVVRRMRG
jgi:tetratricopeptide (TPR) repeat protein